MTSLRFSYAKIKISARAHAPLLHSEACALAAFAECVCVYTHLVFYPLLMHRKNYREVSDFNQPLTVSILLSPPAQHPHLDLQAIHMHPIKYIFQLFLCFDYLFVQSSFLPLQFQNPFRNFLHFSIYIEFLINRLFFLLRQCSAGGNRNLAVSCVRRFQRVENR